MKNNLRSTVKANDYLVYICPKCAKNNWRPTIPITQVDCDYCDGTFWHGRQLSTETQLKIITDTPFRRRIEELVDIHPPNNLFVYDDEAAVFSYFMPYNANLFADWIKERAPMFVGLITERLNNDIAIINGETMAGLRG